LLVIHFGFSEQNGVAMQFLLAIFACFAASLIGLFLVIFLPISLLRFEPNFLFPLFGSEL